MLIGLKRGLGDSSVYPFNCGTEPNLQDAKYSTGSGQNRSAWQTDHDAWTNCIDSHVPGAPNCPAGSVPSGSSPNWTCVSTGDPNAGTQYVVPYTPAATSADNSAYITATYQQYLGRSPQASELSGWLSTLNAGTPRSTLVADVIAYAATLVNTPTPASGGGPATQTTTPPSTTTTTMPTSSTTGTTTPTGSSTIAPSSATLSPDITNVASALGIDPLTIKNDTSGFWNSFYANLNSQSISPSAANAATIIAAYGAFTAGTGITSAFSSPVVLIGVALAAWLLLKK